jgi:hypothetical protein
MKITRKNDDRTTQLSGLSPGDAFVYDGELGIVLDGVDKSTVYIMLEGPNKLLAVKDSDLEATRKYVIPVDAEITYEWRA